MVYGHLDIKYHTEELALLDSTSCLLQVIYSSGTNDWLLVPGGLPACLRLLLKETFPSRDIALSTMSSDVMIRDVTILAPHNSPNTDGIDPGTCFSLEASLAFKLVTQKACC